MDREPRVEHRGQIDSVGLEREKVGVSRGVKCPVVRGGLDGESADVFSGEQVFTQLAIWGSVCDRGGVRPMVLDTDDSDQLVWS